MHRDAVELSERFDWRGSDVRWSRFGDGAPVILCLGTPWSSFVWRSLITALADHRSVYAWDVVGYGQSDKPDDDAPRSSCLAPAICTAALTFTSLWALGVAVLSSTSRRPT